MTAYYNEHDEFAAQWLRNLIDAGHIAPGDVDERDLWDVKPDDLRGYAQAHFCAGIGIWSLAARRAGWEDSRPLWTGSFPCQPFSAAGKRLGTSDERHLWPAGYHLISICRPDVVLGEQVASVDGLGWLEGVQADLEASGYAVGAVDTCAAGFADAQGNEGFHIRQRLYWGARRMGNADNARPQGRLLGWNGADQRPAGAAGLAGAVGLGHSERGRRESGAEQRRGAETGFPAATSGLGHSESERRVGRSNDRDGGRRERSLGQAGADGGLADPGGARAGRNAGTSSETQGRAGLWAERDTPEPRSSVDWLPCRDGKSRPVESGTFPLAYEDTARVGRLRAYGNALDAAQAEGFVRAWMECAP